MENATDAIKTGFAIVVFIFALSIVFSLIGQIKQTADSVLFYTDKTSYYNWAKGDTENGRIVGEDTVIAALHNSDKDLTYVHIEKNGHLIYPSNTKNIQDIVKDYLREGKKYKERIVEVTTGGQYAIGDDGTEITKIRGKTKVYIFYSDDI